MQNPTFDPINQPQHLNKETAAARQVEFAVLAIEAGHSDVAITLSGAAEEMLPGDPDVEISTSLRNAEKAVAELGRKAWIQVTNIERDWLKHRTEHLDARNDIRSR
ncbi:hypothetical protein ABID21_003991 [Pseudorhizobium tarimense]|uniref:Uncharacterized protein n=1 Tax=Pseudorhizobium tarimense TaxID=1079109 RepID=A0ABV2HBD5_9HYPH|nr:hypothetical protein [Pseudorhizobium tarimense]MCJ8520763.1 hypothetical protein [Pseudorhizobium tarimense]